jgi:hypothetical protein
MPGSLSKIPCANYPDLRGSRLVRLVAGKAKAASFAVTGSDRAAIRSISYGDFPQEICD